MPFSSCASTRQVSSSLMRRRVAERDDEADAVDIEAVDDGCGGSRGGGGASANCLPARFEGGVARGRGGLVLYTAHPMPDGESFVLYSRSAGQWGWARADRVQSWM